MITELRERFKESLSYSDIGIIEIALLQSLIKEELKDFDFESIKKILQYLDIEGIVFHDSKSDKMCKIRKSDFGIKR